MLKRKMQNRLASTLLLPHIKLLLMGLFLFGGIAIFGTFSTHDTAHALQSVPYQMNFQGRLNDSTGAPMPNGTYNVRFRIYSVLSGGSALWTDTYAVSASQGVTVTTGGLFSVQLGSITSLPSSIFNTTTPLYLEVELPTPATATTSSPSWTEGAMTPRNPVVSSPYAINSDLLDGLDSTAFAQASGGTGYIQNQTASAQAASFRINGTGSIQGSSTTAFQVQNASSGAVLSVDTTTNSTNVMGALNLVQVSAPTVAPTLAAGAAGLLTGTYYYVATYVTASGETNYGPASAAVTVSGKQVNLTNIPTGTYGSVTARKIYRGTSVSGPFNLVTTINDNTTTTYTDNVTSLGTAARIDNTTASFQQNGISLFRSDAVSYNTAVGLAALFTNTTGVNNTAVGVGSLGSNTTGSSNTSSGIYSLNSNTSGSGNTAMGNSALQLNSTGSGNTGVGQGALQFNTTGSNNTALGIGAGVCDVTNTSFCTGATLQGATAIGAYAQVTQNNSLVLGSVDGGTKVGIGITSPSNLFSVSPLDYQTGTVKRTNGSATLAGTGTTWTSAMVGDIIVFADGTTNTVASFTSATSVTMGTTYTGTTDATAKAYRFHKPGFQVTSAGNAYVQNTSTTAFQVQSAAGTSLFTVDTSGMNITFAGTASTFATLTMNNAHFASTQTTAPTIGVTTCTTSATSVTAGSTDSAGSFSLTASSAANCVATITFNKAYASAPKSVVISPTNAGASAIQAYVSSSTTTTFVVTFNVPATSSTVYNFNYWVVQ